MGPFAGAGLRVVCGMFHVKHSEVWNPLLTPLLRFGVGMGFADGSRNARRGNAGRAKMFHVKHFGGVRVVADAFARELRVGCARVLRKREGMGSVAIW